MIAPFKHIINLFFPTICIGCGNQMPSHKQHLCALCIADLPFTGFEDLADNPVEQIFYGRINIQAATALAYFTKNELIQQCLHEIKYQNNEHLAKQLGNLTGSRLKDASRFSTLDMVIPIALHKVKQRKRGYNQAERIAKPIAQQLQIPLNNRVLKRIENTESQTKKHRFERWENMENKFIISDKAAVKNKHILLIDDVVTTGATLEASAKALIDCGATISIAVLAFAHD